MSGIQSIPSNFQKKNEKGQANGYAALDAGARVPSAELGSGTADTTTFLRGDQTWQTVSVTPATQRTFAFFVSG